MVRPHHYYVILALAACVVVGPGGACAEEKPDEKRVDLKVGDPGPTFQGRVDLPTSKQQDKPSPEHPPVWKSKDHVGKKILVVYFYPADLTPGCTKQACNYRDAVKKLKRNDVEIIGVSGDEVDNHRRFRKEHGLNFTLLADPKGKIAKAFGVQLSDGGDIDFKLDGETVTFHRGVTARRWTFVIGPDNTIVYKDQNVDPRKDTANVLKVIAKIPEIKPSDDSADAKVDRTAK